MVDIKSNDLEVQWVSPLSGNDARVPSAQELAASSHLHQQNLQRAQAIARPSGLMMRPNFACTGKTVTFPAGMAAFAPGHPALAPLTADTTITLPNLTDTVSSVSRYDYVYLAVVGVVVTAAIDSDINLNFEWRAQSGSVQVLSKENTRRIRTVWALVWAPGQISASDLYAALPGTTDKTITGSTSGAGTAIGSYRIYPLDPNLVNGATYTVVQDSLQLVDLCRVWRVQNFTQTGYVWGRGGESGFIADYQIQPTYRYVGPGWESWATRAKATLRRLMLGQPLPFSPGYDRAVYNLLNGQVGSNLDAPGLATASPNGSNALANDQRVCFTNQKITQKYYCLPILFEPGQHLIAEHQQLTLEFGVAIALIHLRGRAKVTPLCRVECRISSHGLLNSVNDFGNQDL